MTQARTFDLQRFLPYLLNQAAQAQSLEFGALYKREYGLLRTEWRVLAHLGCYGQMTAKEICERTQMHKTKISRAVAKLEERRYLSREQVAHDRRAAILTLTSSGARVFEDLSEKALEFNDLEMRRLTEEESRILMSVLTRIAERGRTP